MFPPCEAGRRLLHSDPDWQEECTNPGMELVKFTLAGQTVYLMMCRYHIADVIQLDSEPVLLPPRSTR